MRKIQLAGRMAKQSGVTKAEAADRLDQVVHRILTELRKGHSAALPGLGYFHPERSPSGKWIFEFEPIAQPQNEDDRRTGDAGR